VNRATQPYHLSHRQSFPTQTLQFHILEPTTTKMVLIYCPMPSITIGSVYHNSSNRHQYLMLLFWRFLQHLCLSNIHLNKVGVHWITTNASMVDVIGSTNVTMLFFFFFFSLRISHSHPHYNVFDRPTELDKIIALVFKYWTIKSIKFYFYENKNFIKHL